MAAGMALDALFGDPRRGHPVAGFGRVAGALERRCWAPRRGAGALYAGLLVGAPAALGGLAERRLASRPAAGSALVAGTVWATVGGRSLGVEARAIADLVAAGDLEGARRRAPALVGRDPQGLDGPGLCRAAVESVAENTADAVVGPLLWCAALGVGGAVGYRAANTLDAMVGHRSSRHERFGWAAARLDDVLGWPPARLGAVLACLLAPAVGGRPRAALAVLGEYGARHPSPNAGRMEAAFAGALGLRLGGPLSYDGRVEHRPVLGRGRPPEPPDVHRAAWLSQLVGVCCALLASLTARPPSARR